MALCTIPKEFETGHELGQGQKFQTNKEAKCRSVPVKVQKQFFFPVEFIGVGYNGVRQGHTVAMWSVAVGF